MNKQLDTERIICACINVAGILGRRRESMYSHGVNRLDSLGCVGLW